LDTITFGGTFSVPIFPTEKNGGLTVGGISFGLAISYPGFFGGDFDFGVFGEARAGKGIGTIGKGALEFGFFKCSVQNLEDNDTEIETQLGFTPFGGSVSLGRDGNIRGGSITFGEGIGFAGTQTFTEVISLQELF
jgi:hypothetical protein